MWRSANRPCTPRTSSAKQLSEAALTRHPVERSALVGFSCELLAAAGAAASAFPLAGCAPREPVGGSKRDGKGT
jgi:hypothetical protein